MIQAQDLSNLPVQKPGMVVAISIMTIVNGALNILWSVSGFCAVTLTTFGIGLLCAPFFMYPLVLGILELIYGIKMISNPPTVTQPLKWLAIMEICNIIVMSVNSLIVGILALVFYNDSRVQAYYAQLGGLSS